LVEPHANNASFRIEHGHIILLRKSSEGMNAAKIFMG
jgi:hypothetical protein